ncbi:hypothetical protein NKH18_05545 [Streptomyces sp. M10(2022)]
MGKYRVAVIGGRPAPVAGAKELGIDVVLVHEEGSYDVSVAQHCERIIHGPIADGQAILDLLKPLHDQRPFDRVLTTTEPAAESTGFVADALGLPESPRPPPAPSGQGAHPAAAGPARREPRALPLSAQRRRDRGVPGRGR